MGPSKAASAGVELTTVRGDHLLVDWLEALSLCLAGSEPGRLDDFRSFWADWSSGRIAGGKVTVVAWEGGPPPYGSYRPAAGVARLWESPHCGGKWFVEGLEVIASQRRRGVATSMLQLGIDRLREMGVKSLYAHVRDTNVPSIRTLAKLGFAQVSNGSYVSSCGEKITGGSEYKLDLTGPPPRLTIE